MLRLPLAVRGMGGGRDEVGAHHGDEAENQERWQEPNVTPFLARQMSSGFTTLPPALLQEQPL
jgi:hypothetical protein